MLSFALNSKKLKDKLMDTSALIAEVGGQSRRAYSNERMAMWAGAGLRDYTGWA
mgnify:CR=1 FL=1